MASETEPLFSVVVPTYNRSSLVKTAIESIINQDYAEWELIIVDDGSSDNTKQVVKAFEDHRIKYYFQERGGRSVARNWGIDLSKGNYICFLDSDDTFCSSYLSSIQEKLVDKGFPEAILLSEVKYTTIDGSIVKHWKPPDELQGRDLVKHVLDNASIVPTISMCIHRLILSSNKFDSRFELWEDTHLALRIFINHPYLRVEDNHATALVHTSSTVSKNLQNVDLTDVIAYMEAVKSLLSDPYRQNFRNIKSQYFNQYLFKKYQMYIYQALVNRQYDVVQSVVMRSVKDAHNFRQLVYYVKVLIKLQFYRNFR